MNTKEEKKLTNASNKPNQKNQLTLQHDDGHTPECVTHQLKKPFLIAKAADKTITPRVNLKVNDSVLQGSVMPLGQDAIHSHGRDLPGGCFSISDNEEVLKMLMLRLLRVFALEDSYGTAKKLFDKFLSKNSNIAIFSDDSLDKAIQTSANFTGYPDRTLAAPGTKGIDANVPRIHQLLKRANWDINKVKPIEDLGPPAFNDGRKSPFPSRNTGDWANGLAVMINGVQYVYVYVEEYSYDSCKNQYEIELKFVLYDVFGLDDIDLNRFGVTHSAESVVIACQGITAWWQLQHQFDYAPLLTRAVVHKTYTVSTLGH